MAAAVFVWWVVVGLLWQLDWQVFCSCVRGMDSRGVLPVWSCYCLGNSSIKYQAGVFGYKCCQVAYEQHK